MWPSCDWCPLVETGGNINNPQPDPCVENFIDLMVCSLVYCNNFDHFWCLISKNNFLWRELSSGKACFAFYVTRAFDRRNAFFLFLWWGVSSAKADFRVFVMRALVNKNMFSSGKACSFVFVTRGLIRKNTFFNFDHPPSSFPTIFSWKSENCEQKLIWLTNVGERLSEIIKSVKANEIYNNWTPKFEIFSKSFKIHWLSKKSTH